LAGIKTTPSSIILAQNEAIASLLLNDISPKPTSQIKRLRQSRKNDRFARDLGFLKSMYAPRAIMPKPQIMTEAP